MILHPAVVVHGPGHVRAVLRRDGPPARPVILRPVTLLSAPGAAGFAGCLWWRELVAQARDEFPDAVLNDVLDCAAAPGHAMAALRVGQRRLVLDPACPAFAAVTAAAATLGAEVLACRPPALDLAEPGALRRLPGWLQGDSAAGLA